MKTDNIAVYGHIVSSAQQKIRHVRLLEYICSVSSLLRQRGLPLRSRHSASQYREETLSYCLR